jgi:predicted nuclease of predicted toxin-antitoxin system
LNRWWGEFLLDAQLPKRLAKELTAAGHDALHTEDLPTGNRTPDEDLADLAAREGRVLITKDSDFVTTFHLRKSPPKLLLVSTGNINNDNLLHLFLTNIMHLEGALSENDFVELSRTALTIHG